MKRTIEIIVSPAGEISIDAIGFKGADCAKATRFLEEALGTAQNKVRKPEYLRSNTRVAQQKVSR
jgi:hypothetical protein